MYINFAVSLQDAIKDGPARFVTQRLPRTPESYEEAIKCLKEHYNRPQIVQEEHIAVSWMRYR